MVKPTSPVTGDSVVDVLNKRLRELSERDAELLSQIIEGEGVLRFDDSKQVEFERAERILHGEAFDRSYRPPMAKLQALHAERELIQKALSIGRSRLHEEMVRRGAEVWASHFEEIAAIERRRVMLAIELQRLDLAREELREKLVKAGAPGHLPTDGIMLLEMPRNGDEVELAGDRLVQQKVATRREIEKARNG